VLTADRKARRVMARIEERERHGGGELGSPGKPAAEEETPQWPPLEGRGWVFLGRLGESDLWACPSGFLSASVAYRHGETPQHVTANTAYGATQLSRPVWEVLLYRAIARHVIRPEELGPARHEHERQRMIDDIAWRHFLLPDCSGDPWDPETHGLELDEYAEDPAIVSWKPGRYHFLCENEVLEIRRDGERGNVPAQEPDQKVLRGIHELLSEMEKPAR
jgi:hypothetical protein